MMVNWAGREAEVVRAPPRAAGSARKRSQRQCLLKPCVRNGMVEGERSDDGQGCVPDTGFVVEFVSDKASDDDGNRVDRGTGGEVVRPELLEGEIPQDLVVDADEVAKRVVVGKVGSLCDAGGRRGQGMASNSHEALRELDGRHHGRKMDGVENGREERGHDSLLLFIYPPFILGIVRPCIASQLTGPPQVVVDRRRRGTRGPSASAGPPMHRPGGPLVFLRRVIIPVRRLA